MSSLTARILLVLLGGCATTTPLRPASVITPPAPIAQSAEEVVSVEVVELRALATFQYEEGGLVPREIQTLDGRVIETRGVLLHLEGDLHLLVAELWGRHFGSPPDLNEAVVVTASETVRALEGCPVVIRGRLAVGEVREDGYVTSLYRMQAHSIDVDHDALTTETESCASHQGYGAGE